MNAVYLAIHYLKFSLILPMVHLHTASQHVTPLNQCAAAVQTRFHKTDLFY